MSRCGMDPYRGIEWVGMKVIQYTVYFSGFTAFCSFCNDLFFPSLVHMHTLIPQYVQVSGIGTWVMRFRDMHRVTGSLS